MGCIQSFVHASHVVKREEIERVLSDERERAETENHQIDDVRLAELWTEHQSYQPSCCVVLLQLIMIVILFLVHFFSQLGVGRLGLGTIFLEMSVDPANLIENYCLWFIGTLLVSASPVIWTVLYWFTFRPRIMSLLPEDFDIWEDFEFFSLFLSAASQCVLHLSSRLKVFFEDVCEEEKLGINKIDVNVRQAAWLGSFIFEPDFLHDFLIQASPRVKSDGENCCTDICRCCAFSAVDKGIATCGLGVFFVALFTMWVSVDPHSILRKTGLDLSDMYFGCEIECLSDKGLISSRVIVSDNGEAQNTEYDWQRGWDPEDPDTKECCDEIMGYKCTETCENNEMEIPGNISHNLRIQWRFVPLGLLPSFAFFLNMMRWKLWRRDFDNVRVDGGDGHEGVCCWQKTRSQGCWRRIDCDRNKIHYQSKEEYWKAMDARKKQQTRSRAPCGGGGIDEPENRATTAAPTQGLEQTQLLRSNMRNPGVEAVEYYPRVQFQ